MLLQRITSLSFIAVALPALCFAALLKRDHFRERFLTSAAVFGLFVVFSTEILSCFKLVAYIPLVVCWSVYLLVLLTWRSYSNATTHKGYHTKTTSLPQNVLLALLVGVMGVAGITAIIAAPNNFDSLTYHLPRVMHWIQNRSVAHYPTNIDRQLVMAPFSEFVVMHLQILSGSDRFANCVQWFSMVGSAIGVSLIALALKGSLNCQIISAAVAVSLPMGLLQSTSTQNDYTVTFWLVCLVYFILTTKERSSSKQAAWIGIYLALAILTKGTAYLIAAPFMLIYLWRIVGKGIKTAVTGIALISVAILIINGAHLARNLGTYGNPISPGTDNNIICKRIDTTSIISCVTKNIVSQLASGMQSANPALLRLTGIVHTAIGVDVNDPDLTLSDDFFILPMQVKNHEDYAPNPLHMFLLLVSTGLLAWQRKKTSGEVILFAIATMSSFIILSTCLKWNPYSNRYFLPVFIISAPTIALLFDRIKPRVLVDCCAIALLFSSFFVLANNQMRPLIGEKSVFATNRTDQYFMARPEAENYFISLTNTLKAQPITNIGILNNSGNMLEYLLWMLLKDSSVTYRIEHVQVTNPSRAIKLQNFSTYFPVNI